MEWVCTNVGSFRMDSSLRAIMITRMPFLFLANLVSVIAALRNFSGAIDLVRCDVM